MDHNKALHLFEAFGIELEYMIVDRDSLVAKPICDDVLAKLSGVKGTREWEMGEVAWSNELVRHVIEIKANGPKNNLQKLHKDCHEAIMRMNDLLDRDYQAKLLPTAMHPFFNPDKETSLWQADDAIIYTSYDRIFGCKGHGWSNLQSIHINLPYVGDEFGPLHSAIRLVLPLLSPLAASSPIVEGKYGRVNDLRLDFYSQNQRRIPSIIGNIVPERVFTQKDYETKVLEPMYQDIAPHDPDKILQEEWLNSRAAIPKFEKGCIEIRLLDITECPRSDFAIIYGVVSLLRALVSQELCSYETQKTFDEKDLKNILMGSVKEGRKFLIEDREFLKAFGLSKPSSIEGLWRHVLKLPSINDYIPDDYQQTLDFILSAGSLGERIRNSLSPSFTSLELVSLYQELASCLKEDKLYGWK